MRATRISQFLQSRENLKCVDTPHWIYIAEALVWSAMIIIAGLFLNAFIANQIINPRLNQNLAADGLIINVSAYFAYIILWGSILVAIFYFINRVIFFLSTYVFASDRRLYIKTGLIRVMVNELSFDDIRKTDINYGLLGRFLGYGKLIMDARFVEDLGLPYIYSPEKFAKLIHYSNDLEDDINLSFVTNGKKEKAGEIVKSKSQNHEHIDTMREQSEFAEHAFNNEEKRQIKKKKSEKSDDSDPIQEDFEDVAEDASDDIFNRTINRSSSTSPSVNKVKL